ncbi:hypothetical protein MWU75_17905 [Ornithinimicrobium sp. F0845]|uniref:hypothetical protein n=1 Tax=Ornithinimicrobium sp. F0845 TaxID=2926412 RepID=UPI001FF4212C|nr:hypothetical protein [Ornithinimicrobium sp. F0845]MCK0114020.1 hypothetical protein [Ornithinimicrobium sp. F0845]
MLYIVRFGRQLHDATRDTVFAVEAGNAVVAIQKAPAMYHTCSHLALEALQKAQGSFVRGNDEIYLEMAGQAQAFAQAGSTIAMSMGANGEIDRDAYEAGVEELRFAVSLFN